MKNEFFTISMSSSVVNSYKVAKVGVLPSMIGSMLEKRYRSFG